MVVFFVLLPLVLLAVYRKNSPVVFTLLVILLAVVAGLRNPADQYNDSHNYLTWFNGGSAYLKNAEIGYAQINYLIKGLGLGFQWVLIVVSGISMGVLAWAAKRSGKNALAVVMLYFLLTYYFYNFNAMRQMAGVSFLLLGYTYLKEQRVIPFLCCVAGAALFHTSCLIALVCLLFYKKKVTFHPFVVICCVGVSLLIGSLNITAAVLDSMENLLIKYHVDIEQVDMNKSSLTLSKVLLSLFFIYIYTQLKKDDFYLKVVFIGIVLFNLMSYSAPAMRIAYAFTPVQAFLYASPKFEKPGRNDFNSKLIIVYALFVYYYMLLQSHGLMQFQLCDGTYF